MAWLVLVGVLALVGVVGFWAGRTTLEPPVNPLASGGSGPVTYSVSVQSIGRSLRFSAVAEWERTPFGRVGAGGVVTSVGFSSGDVVEVGDVLFTVGLRPVVVAEGAVPAFRPLSVKTVGADVAQLQTMLTDLGFSDAEPDGVFGSGTVRAVKQWQKSLGVDDDGVVALGDVVFVPKLPARVAATEALTVGESVNPGDVVVVVGGFPVVCDPVVAGSAQPGADLGRGEGDIPGWDMGSDHRFGAGVVSAGPGPVEPGVGGTGWGPGVRAGVCGLCVVDRKDRLRRRGGGDTRDFGAGGSGGCHFHRPGRVAFGQVVVG